MIYFHSSLKANKFRLNKKLLLLKKNVITVGQFITLIDQNDPYVMIGSTVVDKTKIAQFLTQWKNNAAQLQALEDQQTKLITQYDIIQKLDVIAEKFPEVLKLITEFKEKLENATCPKCTKNKYVMVIVQNIKPLMNDGRDLGQHKQFFEDLMTKYYPISGKIANLGNFKDFDAQWIKPDEYIGLGNDLIDGLQNCFECTKKHLSRAKVLYEEFQQGYPTHQPMMFDEMTRANKALQEAYSYYWDSLAQLDMAACQLVGDMTDLQKGYQVQMIELANKIRGARIMFQQDLTKIPDWNKLRIQVQRLQNKIKSLKK